MQPNSDVIMSYLNGYVEGGQIKVTRDPFTRNINQVLVTASAATTLNELGATCVASSDAKNHPELGELTHIALFHSLVGLAPAAFSAIDRASEIRLNSRRSDTQLG
jgi:hypothetical protein